MKSDLKVKAKVGKVRKTLTTRSFLFTFYKKNLQIYSIGFSSLSLFGHKIYEKVKINSEKKLN
ncbi:hypothetical protein KSS87_013456 [Heliosperma pusillum]|nr:hypothetical protein KSS87_013456 [Heliosperma pusillum]